MITRKGFCGIIVTGLVLVLIANVVIAQEPVTFSESQGTVTFSVSASTPEPTNTAPPAPTPPPHIRPTGTPGATPVDPYPGEMEVKCFQVLGLDLWRCYVYVITHGKLTMLGMSDYHPYTYTSQAGNDWWSITFSFYGVECGDIAAKFVLLTSGFPPYSFDRHTAQKYCNFISGVSK